MFISEQCSVGCKENQCDRKNGIQYCRKDQCIETRKWDNYKCVCEEGYREVYSNEKCV